MSDVFVCIKFKYNKVKGSKKCLPLIMSKTPKGICFELNQEDSQLSIWSKMRDAFVEKNKDNLSEIYQMWRECLPYIDGGDTNNPIYQHTRHRINESAKHIELKLLKYFKDSEPQYFI